MCQGNSSDLIWRLFKSFFCIKQYPHINRKRLEKCLNYLLLIIITSYYLFNIINIDDQKCKQQDKKKYLNQ